MKKFVSLVLIIFILISAVSVFALEPDESQLEELKKFEIMTGDPDGSLRLNDTITRAEAVKMIIAAQGYVKDTALDMEKSEFPDVWETHWAKIHINMAKRIGIVEGDENGNFKPESEITNEEIVKMLVNLLGYEPMAETTGGYPAGYLSTASRIGVTNGLVLELETPAKRSDVAIMFANALEIPLMVQTVWSATGSEDYEYKILDGNNGEPRTTIKSAYWGIVE